MVKIRYGLTGRRAHVMTSWQRTWCGVIPNVASQSREGLGMCPACRGKIEKEMTRLQNLFDAIEVVEEEEHVQIF